MREPPAKNFEIECGARPEASRLIISLERNILELAAVPLQLPLNVECLDQMDHWQLLLEKTEGLS